jgi:hypothetical protein
MNIESLSAQFATAAKVADRQTIARCAYETATDESDFREISRMLFECLPKARKVERAAGGEYAPWFSLPPGIRVSKDWTHTIAESTFADGMVIRSYAIAKPGKAWSVGTAARAAIAHYREMKRRVRVSDEWAAVPEITGFRLVDSGCAYDPADATAETVDLRADMTPRECYSPASQRNRVGARLDALLWPESVTRQVAVGYKRADHESALAEVFAATPVETAPARSDLARRLMSGAALETIAVGMNEAARVYA